MDGEDGTGQRDMQDALVHACHVRGEQWMGIAWKGGYMYDVRGDEEWEEDEDGEEGEVGGKGDLFPSR